MRQKISLLPEILMLCVAVIIAASAYPIFTPEALTTPPQLQIVVDKAVYSLGETINTTFFFFNNNTYSVMIPRYDRFTIDGRSINGDSAISAIVQVDWAASQGATIIIPAKSRLIVDRTNFTPTAKGTYTIRIWVAGFSASLSVVIE